MSSGNKGKNRTGLVSVLLLLTFVEGCHSIFNSEDQSEHPPKLEQRTIDQMRQSNIWRFLKMTILSNDLIPQFSDGSEMAVVKIVRVKKTTLPDGIQETGTVTFQVLDVLEGKTLAVEQKIDVAFERGATPQVQARSGFNFWNSLTLTEGEMLLLSCKLLKPPQVWAGISAEKIETVDSPEVNAVRKCFKIEHFQGTDETKRQMLEDALVAEHELLQNYSLDYIGRRRMVTRDIGSKMINKAMIIKGADLDYRLALGDDLAGIYFFDPENGAEDPTNRLIMDVLSRELVRDTTQEAQEQWIDLLATCINSEFSEEEQKNNKIRNKLIRSIPNANQVLSVVSDYARSAEQEEKEIADELITIWKEAMSSL